MYKRKSRQKLWATEERVLSVVSVGRGKSQQHEAMAAVMARILASGDTGSAATTAPSVRRENRAEGLGSVKPKTQRKRRKLKVNDVQIFFFLIVKKLLTSRHNVW